MSDKKVSFNEVLMTIGALFIAAMFFIDLVQQVNGVFLRVISYADKASRIYAKTKIQAATKSTKYGIPMILANGGKAEILDKLADGSAKGTLFVAN